MTDDRVRRYDDPRSVLVLHDDGCWYTGWCEGWVRWPDGWRASVRYVAAVGETYVRVLPEARVQMAGQTPGV